ncbi:uncharacterized protein LOC105211261 [Zeugodacus cucurbitae]|uniref:Uncharacterized protein n=1 Tax=Zeugodacus cucurbitae TaxID=28588 RepID=A0A0A1XGR5_ZEUCU|nr:uncharacterized protein LOC105211261 [Zeugodacus cucurbitae]
MVVLCSTTEDKAIALAYISLGFWAFCTLFHTLIILVHASLDTIELKRCDTALIRFVKTSPIDFHFNSLFGDLLRTGASFILLKAINDCNTNMLVNFLRFKYIEVFLLLILFMVSCFREEANAFVKAYYTMSLVLDLAMLYIIFKYCCELLANK